jgi:polar amino acid transport system permease protein
VVLSFISIIVGTIPGIFLALARNARNLVLRLFSRVFIEIFLAIPVLVLLIWLYFCLPILMPGLRLSGFWVAILGFSLSLSAFVAETVRAGIESIPPGQTEAALSMGMTRNQITWRIVLPQAIRIIIPPLMTQYITCIKLSSLASIIAVNELLHLSGLLIMETFRPLEVYTATAIAYMAIILPLNLLVRSFEKRGRVYRGLWKFYAFMFTPTRLKTRPRAEG